MNSQHCYPHHPPFPRHQIFFTSVILENTPLTHEIFKLTIKPHSEIKPPLPGQFFMLQVGEGFDPLLKRPFSLYDINSPELQFLYRIRGRGTAMLSQKRAGQIISITGPFGRPYPEPEKTEKVLIVAGGMGIASLNYLVKGLLEKGHTLRLLYGARTREEASLININSERLIKVISTDDGSLGKKATVVELLEDTIKEDLPDVIYACGPQAVLRAVDQKAKALGIKAFLSVEERMACGIGVCLGCVIKTEGGYRRVCREGPVFREGEIIW
jgi:dihydroorotate dehydrogenase electron transfer subunit